MATTGWTRQIWSSAVDESEPQAAVGLEGRSHSEERRCFGCDVAAAGAESGSNSACEDEAAGLDFDFVVGTAWRPLPLSGHLEGLNFGPRLDL